MGKKIIVINEEKCIGCGLCAKACKQSAIEMVDGKAKVVREDYCDGLGNCLPVCPVGAISFMDSDENNTVKNVASIPASTPAKLPCGCPGTLSKKIARKTTNIIDSTNKNCASGTVIDPQTELNQWPVQIKLVPVTAPYFENANLLVAADCSAFAYGNFHNKFMRNKITVIGCPKLDVGDYTDKLTAIITENNIKSVTVVRMEVPCCGGIESAVINALRNSGKMIPWQVVVIGVDGNIID